MSRDFIALLAAALLCAGLLPAPLAAAEDPAKPSVSDQPAAAKAPLFAFLDMRQVFEKSQGHQHLLEQLQAQAKEPSAAAKKLQAELLELENALRKSMMPLKWQFFNDAGPGPYRTDLTLDEVLERAANSDTPVVLRLLKEYTLKDHELRGRRAADQLELKAQRVELEHLLLRRIRGVVQKVVKANQISFVLNKRDGLSELTGLQATIDSPLVYEPPEFDITLIVLAKLNEEYSAENAAAEAKKLFPAKQPTEDKPAKTSKE